METEIVHICRTCMYKDVSASKFISIDSFDSTSNLTIKQKLQQCIPELDLCPILNPEICQQCHSSVNFLYNFKSRCLRTELEIHKYQALIQQVPNNLMLAEVLQYNNILCGSVSLTLKPDALNIKLELKTEELDIDENSSVLGYNLSSESISTQGGGSNEAENGAQSSQDHIERESNTDAYQCYTCGYKLKNKHNLILHLKKHITGKLLQNENHPAEKLHKCFICEYRCKWKWDLKRHMLTHIAKSQFECTEYRHGLTVKADLKRHLLTDMKEKPFKCSLCNYHSLRKFHLNRHMLSHTSDKPFKCSVCDYHYSRKEDLKRHLLIHSRDKPLKCPLCVYRCSRKDHLKRHMLIHTNDKPVTC